MKRMVLVVAMGVGGAIVAQARASAACSSSCYGGDAHLLPLGGTTIPANAPGVLLFPGNLQSDEVPHALTFRKNGPLGAEEVRFQIVADGERELLAPDGGLATGSSYTVTASSRCEDGRSPATTTFSVGAPAPAPTSLGALVARGATVGDLAVAGGSRCVETIRAAQVEIELGPSADAAPWEALFRYETFVDGVRFAAPPDAIDPPHRGASWKGRRKDLVFSECDPKDPAFRRGVAEGAHRITMRATLPNGTAVETPAIDVVLSCAVAPDAGVSGGPAPAPPPAPSAEATPAATGCAVVPSSSPAIYGVPALAVGLVAFLRRRRAR